MRARLNPLELSAMASTRSSRATSSTIIACRAGISNAEITPPMRRQREQPADVDPARPGEPPQRGGLDEQQRLADDDDAELAAPVGDHSAVEREEEHRKAAGRGYDAHQNALFVSSSASQPCATVCIHVPISETVCPIQNSRKFRWT